jgi:hypothetical protein
MSAPSSYRCRGLRKWCDRRCEAVTTVAPLGWPGAGFYCALHGYQKPKALPDGSLEIGIDYEGHLKRRTSLVPPEQAIAFEISKSPGMVRDRPGAPGSASGQSVVSWLIERKKFSEENAIAYASRMVALDILKPVSASGAPPSGFSGDKNSLYIVNSVTSRKVAS